MPYSKRQRKAACADYGRAKKGAAPRTMKGASRDSLREMCVGALKKKGKK